MAHRLTKFIAKGTFGDCRDGATTTREVHWTVATIRAVVLLVLLLPLLLCESVCVYIPKKERGVLRVVLWCGVNLCEIYILGSWRTAEFDRQHIHTHIHRERDEGERTNKQASKQSTKARGGTNSKPRQQHCLRFGQPQKGALFLFFGQSIKRREVIDQSTTQIPHNTGKERPHTCTRDDDLFDYTLLQLVDRERQRQDTGTALQLAQSWRSTTTPVSTTTTTTTIQSDPKQSLHVRLPALLLRPAYRSRES